MAPTRAALVAEARGWIGTPYHHQASRRGAGCDCFGLVRGVWRAFYGPEPVAVPAYTKDWGDVTGVETMLDSARAHLVERAVSEREPGDVLVFRMRRGIAKHAGILTGEATFVHATERAVVAEVPLDPFWRGRIAAVFSFPGVE
ncbi:NlpC/P60 family protein [Lutibaculum baratangense]|uniref:NlpC/P60 family peptidase n=1 Tax=Lutibaculum baratangense AMV1 TaxID=631454 RepID=V4T890_9HYPH|nr:NlpC/P60 family protein [Lutibaculum baratangense]ESR22803.1 NlpC/P60 family peptidase [Lutibaculum baratangense AMV1]